MGTYYNPGKNAFEEAVNSEIFIDKTEMLNYINTVVRTKQKYVSVSRPRRFGKTMAADMIVAEYIRMDYDGLKDSVALLMDGGSIKVDTSTYQNDMTTFNGRDDVLSLLIHLGYLGFNEESSEVFIPNREILNEFRASTKSDEWKGVFK